MTPVVMESAPTVRRVLVAISLLVAGALCGIVGRFAFLGTRGAQPEPWHRLRPVEELTAAKADDVPDLAAYLRLEEQLFAEVATRLAREVDVFPAFSRFDPESPTYPGRFERDWNRTRLLAPQGRTRGTALLLHGLTDAPYSLRSVGELLQARGYRVIGLRIPGHGTVPGGLAASTRSAWRAAVRLGVAAACDGDAPEGSPFVLVGYSNGAALALDYTLAAIEGGSGPLPTHLLLLSPAFSVDPSAALARWPARLSRLPRMSKLAWSSIEMEFDPFKFNSFPVLAGAEIYELTVEIEQRLARLEARPGGAGLPPILAVQSVVDATVPPVASLTRLFSRVRSDHAESELVLFDANRSAGIGPLLGPQAEELLALATPGRTFPFRVTLVTNAGTTTPQVEEVSRAPGETAERRRPLALSWPAGVYSLSHVAVPFPPDDPAYGIAASPLGPPFPFGALDLKGERGMLVIPDRLLTRLRWNPFFDYVKESVSRFLALDEPPQ